MEKLDLINNVAENIANGGADQRENNNDDNGYQNENKRVFDQTLTFFFRSEQHVCHLLPFR
jgi:hypothetical protein